MHPYDESIRDVPRTARTSKFLDHPTKLFGSTVMVLKAWSPGEKGVILHTTTGGEPPAAFPQPAGTREK